MTTRLRRLPVLGTVALTTKRQVERRRFRGSLQYWETHYATGGDSGPGSRGALADYKASFVNSFVAEHHIRSVAELGCGDGMQIALAEYPSYVGLDVSNTALRQCVARFADDKTKGFFPYSPGAFADPQGLISADLVISLDVLFHLVEQDIFEVYLRDLFALSRRHVLIYASDEDRESSIGSVTDRPFTAYVRDIFVDWRLVQRFPNPHAWSGDVATSTRSEFFLYSRSVSSDAPEPDRS